MEDGSMWQPIVFLICLLLSALYSMSETALTSLSKIRLRNMQEEGVKGADKIAALVENPNRMLSGILAGNNLANIAASSLATVMAQEYFNNNAVAISTGVVTLAVLIFGEITPKSLAARNSEKLALRLVNFVDFSVKLFGPLIVLLTFITSKLIKAMGGNVLGEIPLITEAEFKTLIEVGHEEGVLEKDEKLLIDNVFDFGNLSVEDIMVNRTDIAACKIDADYDEIYNLFKEEGFSRLPVYEDSIDNIVGILNFRDFILNSGGKDDFQIEKLLREPFFTYESKPTAELFSAMRDKRLTMAIVLDEYGGTSGLVTLEDIVEEIVGEIDDEYDEPREDIICVKEDEYIIDGATKLEDVNEMIGVRLESEDFETIGGYVIGVLGRIPESGETVDESFNRFVIEEIDKNRIVKLRMFTMLAAEGSTGDTKIKE